MSKEFSKETLEQGIFNLLITLWQDLSEELGKEQAAKDIQSFLSMCQEAFDNVISQTSKDDVNVTNK